jgi:hypothetical protein
MEYTKPELVLVGQAESLVLGHTGQHMEPGTPSQTQSSDLEFAD